jgi:hypothetical protein
MRCVDVSARVYAGSMAKRWDTSAGLRIAKLYLDSTARWMHPYRIEKETGLKETTVFDRLKSMNEHDMLEINSSSRRIFSRLSSDGLKAAVKALEPLQSDRVKTAEPPRSTIYKST